MSGGAIPRAPQWLRSWWFWGGFIVALALVLRLELAPDAPEMNIRVIGAGLDAAAANMVSDTDYRGFAQACRGPCDDLQVALPTHDATYHLCVGNTQSRPPSCEDIYVSSGLHQHRLIGGPAKVIADLP